MAKPVTILGISCYYHDSAAALVRDGSVVFAAQEERFTRNKHDESLPVHAIQAALDHAGIGINDVDRICFYEKPFLKFFDRILHTYFKTWPWGFRQYHKAMQEWLTKKLWLPQNIEHDLGYKGEMRYVPHHESHAASSYYCSGFADAAVLTVDGVGEWATTALGRGEGTDLVLEEEIRFPHSLGLLYSAITYYLGFKVNSAEYKIMGLAPYGEPRYMDEMYELLHLKEDGSFALNMEYFTFEYGLTMTGWAIEKLFGAPRRRPEAELTQFHKDVARSLQEITETAMLRLASHAKEITPSKHLCLAGGVALNCVANGRLLREGPFQDIFIQPAAGDAGGALGAALTVWHKEYGGERLPRTEHVYWGTAYNENTVTHLLDEQQLPYETLGDEELLQRTAALLEGENVIGWFQERMEFGPRALGNRSILADARNSANWQKVNRKIKFRESFRPFAPTVLEERAGEYFKLDRPSPYMLLTTEVHEEKQQEIPAVTHVNGTARIQTIRREQNPRYYDLLKTFEQRTGCPVVINTSFNIRGEPIVESPEDALNCFLNTHMDYLVMGNVLLSKKEMPEDRILKQEEYLGQFDLD